MELELNFGDCAMTVLTPLEFLKQVTSLKPGERFVYYKGYLAKQRTRQSIALALEAQELYEQGVILLATKRVGEEMYEYYAIRTKKGKINPSMTFYAKQRGEVL